MAVFNDAVLTDAGRALINAVISAGNGMEFTRIVIGKGIYTTAEKNPDRLKTRTALKSQVQSYDISLQQVISDTCLRIGTLITNYDPDTHEPLTTEDIYMNEVGIMAKGVNDQSDVLYGIAVCSGSTGDFIPVYNGTNPIEIMQDFSAYVSSEAAVNLVYPETAYARADDLEATQAELEQTEEDLTVTRRVLESNIADPYDDTESYTAGDYCIYAHNLYKCTGATTGAFDSTKWEVVDVGGEMEVAYKHSQITEGNPHGVTKKEVGLENVGNFKAVSTEANQGLSTAEKANARTNIGAGTSSFSGSYNDLSDKPTIPTVNNATLTIKKNGNNIQTFSANQSTDAEANITVPTKVSELTNDSGYTTTKGTVTSVGTGAGLTGGNITSSGTIKANLKSETKSSLASASKGSTSSREYAVGLDSSGYLSVNVPWTDTNTWRGIQNNLTSSSTTESLSANQGRLLANGSARDDTKLPLSGGTLTGNLKVTLNGSASGASINLGDGDYVHISEPTDDHMELKARTINLVVSDKDGVKVNGKNVIEKYFLNTGYLAPLRTSYVVSTEGDSLHLLGRMDTSNSYSGLAIQGCAGDVLPVGVRYGNTVISVIDASVSFGNSSYRFGTVYCTSVSHSSDEKEKKDIEPLSGEPAIEEIFDNIDFIKFRWNTDKNEFVLNAPPSSRYHYGVGAQTLDALMHEKGLKGSDNGIIKAEYFLSNVSKRFITGGYQKPYKDGETGTEYDYSYNVWKYKHDMEYDVYNEVLIIPMSQLNSGKEYKKGNRSQIGYFLIEDNSKVAARDKRPPIIINGVYLEDKDGNIRKLQFDFTKQVPYRHELWQDINSQGIRYAAEPMTSVEELDGGGFKFIPNNPFEWDDSRAMNLCHAIHLQDGFDIFDDYTNIILDVDYIGEYKAYLLPEGNYNTTNFLRDIENVGNTEIYDYTVEYNELTIMSLCAIQQKCKKYEERISNLEATIENLAGRLEALEGGKV